MQTLFEMALAFLIMMTVINAGFTAFGYDVVGVQQERVNDLSISQQQIKETVSASESTVKEGNAFDAIYSFVKTLFGAVTGVVGGVTRFINLLLSFGNAWSNALEIIFYNTGDLWTFISIAVIPTINLAQFGAVVYVLLYAVGAARGGG